MYFKQNRCILRSTLLIHGGGLIGFSHQIIVAPTQASWIHRVMVLPSREKGVRDGSRVIATELYSDRLLIVEQSKATKKAFRKKE